MTEGGNKETLSDSSVSKDSSKSARERKEKSRPITKVVIRRLPPSMTEESFLEQVSPIPENDYFYFVKADLTLGQHAFCRAYINFTTPDDIFIFKDKFDSYIFVDSKGNEFPAVVEYAPYQGVPKRKSRKKDPKSGTIESDPVYIEFLESLKVDENDNTKQENKTEFSYQFKDDKKITTTPLLEFIAARKFEKQKARDERKEERRKRDMDRKKQRDEERRKRKDDSRDKKPSKIIEENSDDTESVKSAITSPPTTPSLSASSRQQSPDATKSITGVPKGAPTIKTIDIHGPIPHRKLTVFLQRHYLDSKGNKKYYTTRVTEPSTSEPAADRGYIADNNGVKHVENKPAAAKKKDSANKKRRNVWPSPYLKSDGDGLKFTNKNKSKSSMVFDRGLQQSQGDGICRDNSHARAYNNCEPGSLNNLNKQPGHNFTKRSGNGPYGCKNHDLDAVKIQKPQNFESDAKQSEPPKLIDDRDRDRRDRGGDKNQRSDERNKIKGFKDQRHVQEETKRVDKYRTERNRGREDRKPNAEVSARTNKNDPKERSYREKKEERRDQDRKKPEVKYETREFKSAAAKPEHKVEVKKYSETRREREAKRREARKSADTENLVSKIVEPTITDQNVNASIVVNTDGPAVENVPCEVILDTIPEPNKIEETESINTEENVVVPKSNDEEPVEASGIAKENRDELDFKIEKKSLASKSQDSVVVPANEDILKDPKARRNSLDTGDSEKISEGVKFKRYSSLDDDSQKLDGRSGEDLEKGTDENDRKDPPTVRRIRNKDRPTKAIYQPGRTRLSQQAKEKTASVPDKKPSPVLDKKTLTDKKMQTEI